MHIILALLAIVGGFLFWYYRILAAKEAAQDVADVAGDIRLTIRRLMNRRKYDVHPADCVDDPRLAASGLIVSVATMDAPLSQSEIDALVKAGQATFNVTEREALDIVSYGRWVAGECNNHDEAVRKLARRISKLAGPEAGPDLVRMIEEVATADGNTLGDAEQDAINVVRRTLNVS